MRYNIIRKNLDFIIYSAIYTAPLEINPKNSDNRLDKF